MLLGDVLLVVVFLFVLKTTLYTLEENEVKTARGAVS